MVSHGGTPAVTALLAKVADGHDFATLFPPD
jgi:hypothetical protein